MPRNEINKPSARMGAVLDDFDELEALYNQAMEVIASASPAVFTSLPPKPLFGAIISERTRRQLTLGKVESSRLRMQRLRSNPAGPRIVQAKVEHKLTPAEEAMILEELANEPAVLDIELPADGKQEKQPG